jgi:hypothetical protein
VEDVTPAQGTANILPQRKPVGRPRKVPVQALPKPVGAPSFFKPIALPDRDAEVDVTADKPQNTSEGHSLPKKKLATHRPPVSTIEAKVTKRGRGRPRKIQIVKETAAPKSAEASINALAPPALEDKPEDMVTPYIPDVVLGKRSRGETNDDADRAQRMKISAVIAQILGSPYDANEAAFDAGIDDTLSTASTHASQIPIPLTYRAAINDPDHGTKWKEAIEREVSELKGNDTWEEVDIQRGVNLVSTKWVFTVKRKLDGTVERFKARLVARGFSQVHGIDYTETFAPTVRMDTLRTLLAMVAHYDLECHQVDVNNAFTESGLEEKIHLSPPTVYIYHQENVFWFKRAFMDLSKQDVTGTSAARRNFWDWALSRVKLTRAYSPMTSRS